MTIHAARKLVDFAKAHGVDAWIDHAKSGKMIVIVHGRELGLHSRNGVWGRCQTMRRLKFFLGY